MRGVGRGRQAIGLVLLIVLLAFQLYVALASVSASSPTWAGDEPAYVGKAADIRAWGAFPRDPEESRGRPLPGDFWGNSDWRPVGYPLFLAAFGGAGLEPRDTRLRVTVIQFAGVAVSLLLLYALAIRWLGLGGRMQIVAAALLGLQPWTFAYVGLVGPESLTLTATWIGLVLLASSVGVRGRLAAGTVFAGTLALSLAGILRPECLALAPPVVALALWHGHRKRGSIRPTLTFACLALLAVASLQIGYRWQLRGRLEVFGPARFFNEGFFSWVHTWVSTEKGAYDGLAYRIGSGTVTLQELPNRAFQGDREREEVGAALERIRTGGYSREVDEAFRAIAARKAREAPFSAFLVPRVIRTLQLWLNLETNSQLLGMLAKAPRAVSRSAIAAALAVRIGVLCLFFVAIASIRRKTGTCSTESCRVLLLLSIAYVVLRTALVGVLGWGVARYATPMWMPMLWSSLVGLAWLAARGRTWQEGPVA